MLSLFASFVGGFVFFALSRAQIQRCLQNGRRAGQGEPTGHRCAGHPDQRGDGAFGSIHTSGDTGDANLNIPISGPKGKGTIFVTASKSGGIWYYSKMNVHVDGTGEEIDINEPSP